MVSKLEDIFLRHHKEKSRLRTILLECLDDSSIRKLRLVSRILHGLLDRRPDKMFGQLFVSAPWSERIDINSLKAVAPGCRTLVVKIGHEQAHSRQRPRGMVQRQGPNGRPHSLGDRNASTWGWWRTAKKAFAVPNRNPTPSSVTISIDQFSDITRSTDSSKRPVSSRSSDTSSQNIWTEFLSHCKQLEKIVIITNGEPTWPGRTNIEVELVQLRVALESAHLPSLRYVSLSPVHAMGIIHLRWSGFAAFGDVSISPTNIWSNLHTLDVQLKNPFSAQRKLSERRQVIFKKTLYDYLRSFATTLKCLRFVWLDGDGPSPMTLDLEPGLEGHRHPIMWTALEEVYLGNIMLPHRTIRLLPERVVKANVRLKTLRGTHRNSRVMFDDENAWLEVLLNLAPHGIKRGRMISQASSVYSQ